MDPIERLYLLYKKDVYCYLLTLTHNPTLAEDFLSETFVQAMGSLQNFKGRSSIKTWLCSIARNVWLQSLRKERDTVELNDLLQVYVTDGIVEQIVTAEIIGRIGQLLLEKDERTKKIVQMRVDGFSFAEIAQTLTIAESSARVIDFRIKKWLKATLVKEGLL